LILFKELGTAPGAYTGFFKKCFHKGIYYMDMDMDNINVHFKEPEMVLIIGKGAWVSWCMSSKFLGFQLPEIKSGSNLY